MIYIISDGSEYVKIGRTSDYTLRQRMKQLQCGNPRNLKILKEIYCDGRKDMYICRPYPHQRCRAYSEDIERALHIEFKDFMAQTEWNQTSEWFNKKCVENLLNMNDVELTQYLQELENKHGW